MEVREDPLAEELALYESKWVAILETEQRIVASGSTALEAKTNAEAEGYQDTALFKVPKLDRCYVLSA